MPMLSKRNALSLIAALLCLSLNGCGSLCGSGDLPALSAEPNHPPKIRAELMEPERTDYSQRAQETLKAYRQKLEGSP